MSALSPGKIEIGWCKKTLKERRGVAMWESAPTGILHIHPQRKNSAVNYHLETCTNLVFGNWTNNCYTLLPKEGSYSNDSEAVTNSMPTGHDQTFIRLIVEQW
jgi:hypothetical protein